MCSIIGYIGSAPAAPLLVQGLRRMEYRGYDSAGVATIFMDRILVKKGVGRVFEVNNSVNLDSLPGNVGIGHTRWATHGGVTEANAHPHLSSSNGIAIVHNGIIDNYLDLKRELLSVGYTFKSETDSEVIANLLQRNYDLTHDFKKSMIATLSQLKGKYAFIAISKDGDLAAARFQEPLMIGVGKQSYFVSSDIVGFVGNTDEVVYLDNGEFAMLSSGGISVSDFEGNPTNHQVTKISKEFADADKRDYVHYTLKEIYEQPTTILRAGETTNLELDRLVALIMRSKNVYITGSGTSFNAALIGKYIFSKYARIKIEPIISSETQFSPIYFDSNSILIALSQSGESADVLETANIAKENGAEVISIVNVMTSSLAHISSISIGLNCGPEIGVAATKSFTSQLAILYKLTDKLCGVMDVPDFNKVSSQISKLLSDSNIQKIARELKDVSDIYVLGNGVHHYVAMEASLKLKELSYIHAESFPAGELKHGPLALLDSNAYVIVINPNDSTYASMSAATHEVKARGAKVIGISNIPSEVYDYWITLPDVDEAFYPLIEVVPLQLLAYYSAIERNANPDYPRNLAKSVTVK
ncbi:MAG: glutamine--fructose-6-phosphate transaminase (isomerizing) [Thaumarchaeota archaeon]|nr:glutamine--fructose-6-phosphate transaminase (isomerizing) [Nitrososphaerota archaeon]